MVSCRLRPFAVAALLLIPALVTFSTIRVHTKSNQGRLAKTSSVLVQPGAHRHETRRRLPVSRCLSKEDTHDSGKSYGAGLQSHGTKCLSDSTSMTPVSRQYWPLCETTAYVILSCVSGLLDSQHQSQPSVWIRIGTCCNITCFLFGCFSKQH